MCTRRQKPPSSIGGNGPQWDVEEEKPTNKMQHPPSVKRPGKKSSILDPSGRTRSRLSKVLCSTIPGEHKSLPSSSNSSAYCVTETADLLSCLAPPPAAPETLQRGRISIEGDELLKTHAFPPAEWSLKPSEKGKTKINILTEIALTSKGLTTDSFERGAQIKHNSRGRPPLRPKNKQRRCQTSDGWGGNERFRGAQGIAIRGKKYSAKKSSLLANPDPSRRMTSPESHKERKDFR